LARDGFAIVVNYAGNAAKAGEVVAEIRAAGGHAIAVQADVANVAEVESLFKHTQETFGRIDVGWCRSIGGKVIGISHRRASS
jgi:3-oxoacyl-[acyl-carrier protein] reductase